MAAGFLAAMALFAIGFSPFLPMAGALLIGATAFCLKAPVPFLGTITVIRMVLDYSAEYLSIQIINGLTLTLSQLMGAGLFFVGVLYCAINIGRVRTIPFKTVPLILLMFGALTLSYSIDRQETLKELLRIADLFILYAVSYAAVRGNADHRKLTVAILLSACVPGAIGFYQFVTQAGFYDETLGISRIYGTFSHPNVFSLYLFIVIAAAFLYARLYVRASRQHMSTMLLMTLGCVLLVLTLTRVGWIAMLVFAFLVAMASDRRWVAALAAVSLAVYAFSPIIRDRIDATLHPQPGDSITWRMDLWEDGILQTLQDDRRIAGYGLNTFPIVAEHLREDRFGGNDPHNDFVKSFVEGGVIGLAVWLIYIGGVVIFLVNRYRTAPTADARLSHLVLLGVFMGMVVAGLSDNAFKNTPLQWVFWLLMGATLGAFKTPAFPGLKFRLAGREPVTLGQSGE